MILHIVSRSPFSHDALQRCLACASAEDAIMLIEDGVYALSAADRFLAVSPVSSIYALDADCRARGLPAPTDPIQVVDYGGFVDLSARFDKTLSWF